MRIKLFRYVVGISLLCFHSAWTHAQSFPVLADFDTLENIREFITIPELSAEENRVIAEQAQILLTDLYVNRQAKQDFYEGEVPDPVPLIDATVAAVDDLSTTEVSQQVYDIFVSQRDLHLNYLFPAPMSDFTSFLPLTLTRTADRFDDLDIRVSATSAAMFAQFAPNQRVPAVGDLVVGYDGLSIEDAIERQMATSQGANRYGGISRALGQLTFVPHIAHFPPETNEITITFQEGTSRDAFFGEQEGPEYSITIPWITAVLTASARDIAGTASAESLRAEAREILDGNPADRAEKVRAANSAKLKESAGDKVTTEDLSWSMDIWQNRFNAFQKQMDLKGAQLPSLPTLSDELTFGIIENRFGRFAYLRLEAFFEPDLVMREARRLIDEEFRDTDGLIFDIRDNPGGFISLADNLSQLFTGNSRVEITNARALNTPLNGQIFNDNVDVLGRQWVRAFNRGARRNGEFTDTTFIGERAPAVAIGQAYFGPVAVFNNARSFSASDLFTCSMRDNDAALVFGEDPLTGAGGANVITHDTFLALAPDSSLEPLPGGHAMRASWRQVIRTGDARGEIVEDNACGFAGLGVDLSRDDLLNDNEDQVVTMTRELRRLARAPGFAPSGQTDGFEVERVLFSNDPNPSVDFEVTKTDRIALRRFRRDEPTVSVGAGRNETLDVTIPLRPARFKRRAVYRFFGQDIIGRQQWNTRRNYTTIGNKFLVGAEGLDLTFDENSENDRSLAVLNLDETGPEEGWSVTPQGLEYNSINSSDRIDFANLLSSAYIGLDLSNITNADLEVDYEFIAPSFISDVAFLINLIDGDGIEFPATDILDFQFADTPFITQRFDISQAAGNDTVLVELQASGIVPTFDADTIRVTGLRVIPK